MGMKPLTEMIAFIAALYLVAVLLQPARAQEKCGPILTSPLGVEVCPDGYSKTGTQCCANNSRAKDHSGSEGHSHEGSAESGEAEASAQGGADE